ncbi:MAG: hypothetical protein WCW87_03440 [Candidatus Paceibacterota bacterium]
MKESAESISLNDQNEEFKEFEKRRGPELSPEEKLEKVEIPKEKILEMEGDVNDFLFTYGNAARIANELRDKILELQRYQKTGDDSHVMHTQVRDLVEDFNKAIENVNSSKISPHKIEIQ